MKLDSKLLPITFLCLLGVFFFHAVGNEKPNSSPTESVKTAPSSSHLKSLILHCAKPHFESEVDEVFSPLSKLLSIQPDNLEITQMEFSNLQDFYFPLLRLKVQEFFGWSTQLTLLFKVYDQPSGTLRAKGNYRIGYKIKIDKNDSYQVSCSPLEATSPIQCVDGRCFLPSLHISSAGKTLVWKLGDEFYLGSGHK